MSDPPHDHPDVAIFPPVVPLATLGIACGLQWLMPLELLVSVGAVWRICIGIIAVIAGALITASGRIALVRLGTNVNPLQPTTALATQGIFAWTRNPLYIGIAPVICGVAFIFGLDWLLLLVVPSYFLLHFCVIKREEEYLEHKFGEEYRLYKARVPRYVPLFRMRTSSQARSGRQHEI